MERIPEPVRTESCDARSGTDQSTGADNAAPLDPAVANDTSGTAQPDSNAVADQSGAELAVSKSVASRCIHVQSRMYHMSFDLALASGLVSTLMAAASTGGPE